MKSLTQFIKESIDEENIFFKMSIFFQKDELQHQLFNALFIDEDVEKAVRDGFMLKEFVDFVFDDLCPAEDKDYSYHINRIIQILKAKNYQPL